MKTWGWSDKWKSTVKQSGLTQSLNHHLELYQVLVKIESFLKPNEANQIEL